MDDRQRGFIANHRRLRTSPLYRSLSAEQRSVFHMLLLLANWRPNQITFAGKIVTVARGELCHSLETIAEESAVTVKVVRSALRKMFLDFGNGPFLKERFSGTETGRGLRVLTIVNYDKYQRLDEEEGTETGTTRARHGHDTGTAGAAIEQREQEEPREPKKQQPAQKAPPNPRHAPLIARLVEAFQAEKREAYPFDGKKHPPAVSRLLALCDSDDRIVAAWRRSIALAPKWPGTCDLAAFASRLPEFSGAAPPGKQPVIAPMSKEFREEDKPF